MAAFLVYCLYGFITLQPSDATEFLYLAFRGMLAAGLTLGAAFILLPTLTLCLGNPFRRARYFYQTYLRKRSERRAKSRKLRDMMAVTRQKLSGGKRKQRIAKQRSQADALLSKLRKDNKPKPPPPDLHYHKRELLKRELAPLQDAQKNLDASHEAAGKTMVELQTRIDKINKHLAELSPPPETDDTLLMSERALLDEAIARAPDNAALYADRAWHLYKHTDQYDEALADAERALKIIPNDPTVLNTRACIHEAKRDFPEAIRDYRRCIKLNPDTSAVRNNLADFYIKRGLYKNAIPLAEKALKIGGDTMHSHQLLADAHYELGNHENALHHYANADPNSSANLSRQAELHHKLGHDERALHDLKTLDAQGRANQADYDLLITLAPSYLEPNQPALQAQMPTSQREKQSS